jgi:SIR2-like domain
MSLIQRVWRSTSVPIAARCCGPTMTSPSSNRGAQLGKAMRRLRTMTGHLFIVHSDLTTIACDAILVPTDEQFTFTESWDSLELERPESGWGDKKVIQYLDRLKEPQIWLGKVGQPGSDNEFAQYEPAVKEFIRRATANIPLEREGRIYNWPRLRLALNVIGSGEGGGRERSGALVLGLVELLRSLANEYDVDVVLATYGDKLYAGAQRARRQLLRKLVDRRILTTADLEIDWKFADFTPPDLPAKAEKLAHTAIDNHLVLFIGAGVSAGAGIPTWKELLSKIARNGGIDDVYLELLGGRDLRDWATLIDRKLNSGNDIRQAAAELIKRSPRCSLQHALLASLPSTEAVTTNFDRLFEVASRVADRDLSVLPTHPQRSSSSWLLKLHGSIDKPSDMVLTRSDYLDMPRYHGALMGLVQGLLLTRHMMYVGYSLSDEDFHELIHEVRAARGASGAKPATMLTLRADQAQRDLWSDDLEIIAMTRPGIKGKSPDDPEVARELEIFLDLVGFLSTTSAAFFLDPAYGSLSEEESGLRNRLDDLVRTIAEPEQNSVAHKVDGFLRSLGAPPLPPACLFTARFTAADLDAERIRFPTASAKLLPEVVATLTVELRGARLSGEWNPLDSHRCATLHLGSHMRLASLVGLGERLAVSVYDETGVIVLK